MFWFGATCECVIVYMRSILFIGIFPFKKFTRIPLKIVVKLVSAPVSMVVYSGSVSDMKSYNLVHFIISVLYISICLNWFRICQALTWFISIIQFVIVVVVDLSKKKKTSSSTVIMDKIWEMSEMYFL